MLTVPVLGSPATYHCLYSPHFQTFFERCLLDSPPSKPFTKWKGPRRGATSKASQRRREKSIRKERACFRSWRTEKSEGAEDTPLGAPFLYLKCRLNSVGWLIIFLYQNQVVYLLSSYNAAKNRHIFAPLSFFMPHPFFYPIQMKTLYYQPTWKSMAESINNDFI